jgi:hypothetical protein
MMIWRFNLVVWTVGLLALSGCGTKVQSVTSIVLDFPHGEARILIQRDGGTHLFCGALPTSRTIPQGTFDIDDVYGQLETRLHRVVPAEQRPLGQPYGMVSIGFKNGDSRDYLIYDGEYAKALLGRACKNRVREEDSAAASFEEVCAGVLGSMP